MRIRIDGWAVKTILIRIEYLIIRLRGCTGFIWIRWVRELAAHRVCLPVRNDSLTLDRGGGLLGTGDGIFTLTTAAENVFMDEVCVVRDSKEQSPMPKAMALTGVC
jgi:hypothetical protein